TGVVEAAGCAASGVCESGSALVLNAKSAETAAARLDNMAANAAQFERQKAAYAAEEIANAIPVGSALKDDPLHRAPSYVLAQIPDRGRVFTIKGGDGTNYTLTQMEGVVDGKAGIYEWLVNSQGELTHQRFIRDGMITGTPNQIPSKLK
ncbi:hypothetical protein CQ054_22970, partial [Ochrobactrum sp. MYb29]